MAQRSIVLRRIGNTWYIRTMKDGKETWPELVVERGLIISWVVGQLEGPVEVEINAREVALG